MSATKRTRPYDPQAVGRAQQHWVKKDAYRVTESETKAFYACSMLPYPSGKLHAWGHVRNYTINDMFHALPAHERSQRADAHGLGCLRPAGENAA